MDRILIALNLELPAEPPARVMLIPAGSPLVGRDGRAWVWDETAQQSVIRLFSERGLPLPVDVNHAQELRARRGEESPAYAWINGIDIVDGALWGDIEWTPRGDAAVRNREYRFLSPVFDYSSTDNRVMRLTSVGLVNEPNLRLPALNQEQPMSQRTLSVAIVAALAGIGVAADATDDQIVSAINALKSERDTLRATNAQQPTLDRYVPRADYDAMSARATNAEQQLRQREADAHKALVDTEIAAALAAGKITPATEAYHRACCADQSGLERFRAFVAAAPEIGGAAAAAGKPPGTQTATALNAEERAICAATGISEEAFIKARNA